MCWSAEASVAMVAVGGVATVVTVRRGDPVAIWAALGYFTFMEALQAAGYAVVDQCGTPGNRVITQLSYLHIAFQPLLINAFAMAIAPVPVSPKMRKWVFGLAGLATAVLLLRLVPFEPFGRCVPPSSFCGPDWCLRSGEWHIAWEVPLNGLFSSDAVLIPSYFLAVFLLPLVYRAWRFVVFLALAGPLLAMTLTSDPNEMPAIWCLFSIGIILISLSPTIRHRVMGAPVQRPA